MTQYEAILNHLRKHRIATIHDLSRFSNYPWKRIEEMEERWYGFGAIGSSPVGLHYKPGQISKTEIILRSWVMRNGKRVRLYSLVRA